MKTYWTPQNNVCLDCQWPLFGGETYCPDCQGANERIQAANQGMKLSSIEFGTPLHQKLTVDMSEAEYGRYKRIYGSCLDEERGVVDYELLS